ncbi:MAG: oxygen-independent coproporphyrinogen III oxidase [Planctomycetota bacterium]
MSDLSRITPALLARYDQPGPRYTSYPTAPVWSPEFSHADWRAAMADADREADRPLSLYVHIPYCDSMCWYCGCSVLITKNVGRGLRYVDYLLREAELLAEALPNRRRIAQHHWGGGTPTFLPPKELERLYTGLQRLFPSEPDAEVSIEVDPRVTSIEQLEVLAGLGFNRISMGVQDFTREVQEAIHRVQSVEETLAIVDGARRLGFASVNVDLVHGLPYQTTEGFGETVDTIIAWGIDRVACYSYAHVPWLKKHQRVIPEEALPGRDEKHALFLLALERFAAAGYEALGLDHFARPDDPLSIAARSGTMHRNFMGYTTRMASGDVAEDMLNLGITAIGEVAGRFTQNVKELRRWEEAIDRGEPAIEKGWRRSADDEERRRIILDLMCRFRLDFSGYEDRDGLAFAERHARALAELRPMQDDGLVEVDADGVRVLEPGRIFLRNVAMPFDAYLRRQRESDRPMFSRTI